MIEVTAAGSWFHVSGESETSASQWVEGSPRKGLYTGKRNMSLIVFDRAQLAEAIDGKIITGAELVLTRDVSYGNAMVTLTVAPASRDAPPTGYRNRKQCLEICDQTRHHLVNTEGAEAVLPIASATIEKIQAGEANAFVLYHSEDEEADAYIKFQGDAKLRLYLENSPGWRMPVWTRTISSGAIISDETHSHVLDLYEILYAINVRHRVRGGSTEDHEFPSGLDVGAYEDWADVIEDLQDAADAMLADEEITDLTWTAPTAGMMPDAAIIDELRHAVSGDGQEQILASTGTVTASTTPEQTDSDFDETADMTWYADSTVYAGKTVRQERPAAGITITLYSRSMGGWLFDSATVMGASVTQADFQLTVQEGSGAEGKVHITLYGMKVTEAPATAASYDSVFWPDPIGEADCVIGETSVIPITAAGVLGLNSGDIKGIGLRYDNDKCACAKNASLLLNGAEAEEEEEEET